MIFLSQSRQKGRTAFTLIELLVAIGVFSVVMVLSAGAYLTMIRVNQRAQSVALVANNMSFMLESMTRLIRTGSLYSCGGVGDCPQYAGGGTSFTFRDPSGKTITYDRVLKAGAVNGYIRATVDGVAYSLTDPGVDVTTLTFYVTGTPAGVADYSQPFVRISIAGTANAAYGQTFPFSIETAAVMRGIDI